MKFTTGIRRSEFLQLVLLLLASVSYASAYDYAPDPDIFDGSQYSQESQSALQKIIQENPEFGQPQVPQNAQSSSQSQNSQQQSQSSSQGQQQQSSQNSQGQQQSQQGQNQGSQQGQGQGQGGGGQSGQEGETIQSGSGIGSQMDEIKDLPPEQQGGGQNGQSSANKQGQPQGNKQGSPQSGGMPSISMPSGGMSGPQEASSSQAGQIVNVNFPQSSSQGGEGEQSQSGEQNGSQSGGGQDSQKIETGQGIGRQMDELQRIAGMSDVQIGDEEEKIQQGGGQDQNSNSQQDCIGSDSDTMGNKGQQRQSGGSGGGKSTGIETGESIPEGL